jgi:hypothetical protein
MSAFFVLPDYVCDLEADALPKPEDLVFVGFRVVVQSRGNDDLPSETASLPAT